MIKKIVNKARSFWKHGKHKGKQEIVLMNNSSRVKRPLEPIEIKKHKIAK